MEECEPGYCRQNERKSGSGMGAKFIHRGDWFVCGCFLYELARSSTVSRRRETLLRQGAEVVPMRHAESPELILRKLGEAGACPFAAPTTALGLPPVSLSALPYLPRGRFLPSARFRLPGSPPEAAYPSG